MIAVVLEIVSIRLPIIGPQGTNPFISDTICRAPVFCADLIAKYQPILVVFSPGSIRIMGRIRPPVQAISMIFETNFWYAQV